MATRLVGVESTDPRLPTGVINTTKGTTAADLAPGNVAVNKADKTTTITTTPPLAGGGDLSSNRTLTVATFDTANPGVVPASGGGTTNYLRADATWAAPAGGGGGITTEDAVDAVAAALIEGAGIDIVYNDAANTITVTADKTEMSLTKTDVGLGNVDNTADTAKPISTATQTALDAKQPLDGDLTTIAALTATTDNLIQSVGSTWASRTPAQLKTTLALTKTDVGLGNVDNTTDATKPVSTAQQAALDAKQPLDTDLTTIAGLTATTDNVIQSVGSAWASRTPAQLKTALALVKGDVGLGSVDNTADTAKPVSTAQATADALKVDKAQTINAQTGTTYTLVLTDDSKLVTLSNAAAIALTVPTNASVAFPVGTHIDLVQKGAGQVTVGGTPTVNSTPTKKSRAQYSGMTLVKEATDTWYLFGDLAAT